MTTTIDIRTEKTFVKTDKNRELILKKYNYKCSDCKQTKTEDDLDVYIIDINSKPHTILPLCKSCHEKSKILKEQYTRHLQNIIVSKKNEKEYKEAKHRFRTSLRNAYDDMNTMIRILSEDNPGWLIKRIIKQILIENEDIGISPRSMYNHLDDQNRALIDPKYHHKPSQENIVIDTNGANLHHIRNDSSIFNEIDNMENQTKKELTNEEKEEKAKKLLPEPIYNYAKEREISPDKILMIANPRLIKHPKLQESLINNIVTKSEKEAKNTVDQEIMDLETGATVKRGESYVFYESKREKIDTKPNIVKHPAMAYLDIIGSVQKLCENLTGHKLERSEFEYTNDHFKYTKEHRQEIVRNTNDKRSLIALNNQLVLIADYADDFIEMIEEALKDMDNKPDLTE